MILVICAVQDVSRCLDIPTLEFSTISERLSPLPQCMLMRRQLLAHQSGSLARTPIIFAAVIWDADEHCSVKSAQAPESSFFCVTSEHNPQLCFWYFGSNSACLRWPIRHPVPAMWSSWSFGRDDSRRCLVDSWASTFHAWFVFGILLDSHFFASVSWNGKCFSVPFFAILMVSLYYPSSGSMK